jgi:autotransporter-associated beta strand protein
MRTARVLSAAVVAAVLGLPHARTRAATATWQGGGTTLNWSDAANWTGNLPADNDVVFGSAGAGATQTTITNVVDANFTIQSLLYGQAFTTIPDTFHTTQIAGGVTLNITGDNGLRAGLTAAPPLSGPISFTSITGPGLLNVSNTNAEIVVTNNWSTPTANPGQAVLDLSGLATFNANVNNLLVGTSTGGAEPPRVSSPDRLVLAGTNKVTASTIEIGSFEGQGELLLGGGNTLSVDTLRVGYGNASGRAAFDGNRANAWLALNQHSPTGVVINVGDMGPQTSLPLTTSGDLDLSGGTATVFAQSIVVGRSTSTDPTAVAAGSMTVNAGPISTSSLVVGQTTGGSKSSATGTFTLTGGLAEIGPVLLADRHGTGAVSGTLNVAAGTLTMNYANIVDGGGTSTVIVGPNASLELWSSPYSPAGNLGSAAEPIDQVVVNGTIRGSVNSYVRDLSGSGTIEVLGTMTLLNSGNATIGNVFTGHGRLELAGSGTVTLAGTSSISAITRIHVGANEVLDTTAKPLHLRAAPTADATNLSGYGTVLGTLFVDGGTTLFPGSDRAAGTITFQDTLAPAGGTLTFDLADNTTVGGGVNDLIQTRDLVISNSTVTVSPTAGRLASGTYRLINYSGAVSGSLSNLVLAGPLLSMRQSAALDTTTPGQVNLVVSGSGPESLVWSGATSAAWNLKGNSNFVNGGGAGAADKFYQFDALAFTDASTNTTAINLQGDLAPGILTVSATRDYTFAGSGSITGATGLTKSGAGKLTLGNNSGRNTFTGPVTILGGTLSVPQFGTGPATALGAQTTDPAYLVLDGGTLQSTAPATTLTRGFTLGLNGGALDASGTGAFSVGTNGMTLAFTGAGPRTLILTGTSTAANYLGLPITDGPGGTTALVKNGAGTWGLAAPNSFTGTITVNAGILQAAGRGVAASTNPVVVNPGGTLDVGGSTLYRPLVIIGAGAGGKGALVNNGSASNYRALTHLTLAGDAAVGGSGRLDVRGTLDGALLSTSGNGYKLTKVGPAQFSLVNVAVDPKLGDIDIQQGVFNAECEGVLPQLFTTSLGDPDKTITVAPGAVLAFYGMETPIDKRLQLNSGTFRVAWGPTNAFVGPVSVNGSATLDLQAGSVLRLGGVISGANGALTEIGNGTAILEGLNTYTGTTRVSAGTLRVTGSISESAGISVDASATFDAAASQRVQSLSVAAGGKAIVSTGVLTVGDGSNSAPLNLGTAAASATLDLQKNGIVIDTAPGAEADALALVRERILAAFKPAGGGAAWTGAGITSSDAATDRAKAVGYALAGETLGASGGDFMGTAADASSVLARYTLLGDATLDGTVDFNDLVKLAQDYNTTVPAGESGWYHGDFNYDDKVDFNDLVKLAQNYNGSLPVAVTSPSGAIFNDELARALASVPEPSLLGLLGTLLVARRRRRP